jgi:general secretion pathway protein G
MNRKQFNGADRGRIGLVVGGFAKSSSRGFTLLELVMVMTIVVILAAISVSSYQHLQTKAKETILKEDLKTMRRMIDQYQADKEGLPASLDDLVSAGYLREVPVDPFTNEADWIPEMGEDTVSRIAGAQGMVDVHSNAAGTGSDGTPYGKY